MNQLFFNYFLENLKLNIKKHQKQLKVLKSTNGISVDKLIISIEKNNYHLTVLDKNGNRVNIKQNGTLHRIFIFWCHYTKVFKTEINKIGLTHKIETIIQM